MIRKSSLFIKLIPLKTSSKSVFDFYISLFKPELETFPIFGDTGNLNDIKMLMNYGYDSMNYFTLILCGKSHLNDTLRKPVHEALRQRITVHCNYTRLSDEEVAQNILHKIGLASAAKSIIYTATHSYNQSSPRLIDNLMTDTLAIRFQQDKK